MRGMKRVGLIGCGAIGRPVARALLTGKAGSHSLAAVLARAPRDLDGFPVTATADRFLAGGHDLIIEAGGPAAFRALVPAALERCEVWAVSPIPLADPVLEHKIRGISASTGHALRIAPGALAAFDGIATAMAGGLERLDVFIDLGGWMPGDRTRFFIDFASTLFRQTRGARWLVIDEVHNFAPQGKVMDPDAGKMLHWANRIITEGRGKGALGGRKQQHTAVRVGHVAHRERPRTAGDVRDRGQMPGGESPRDLCVAGLHA